MKPAVAAPVLENTYIKATLALTLVAFAIGAAAEGAGPDSILQPTSLMVLLIAIFATFVVMFIAAERAYRVGRQGWMLACIFAWPCAYIYTLAIDRTESSP